VKVRRKKIAAAALGGCAVVVIGVLIAAQTQWFSDIIRNRVVNTFEDSTGGRVEIGNFQLDPVHLTVRIRDLVLHGTEPKNVAPLARISYLELRLKLLSGFKEMIDLAYLRVDEPRVNLIINADGSTNIPVPKIKQPSGGDSTLKTVVDLAVKEFHIERGSIVYSQRKDSFSMQGQNLRSLFQYNGGNQSYRGFIRIDPLKLSYGTQPPLLVRVDLPLELQKDEVKLTNASLTTALSQILLNASVAHLSAPRIALKMTAQVSANEMAGALGVPVDRSRRAVLHADIDGTFDQPTRNITLPKMHIGLGNTTLDASGQGPAINFNGNLALAEMSRLFKMSPSEIKADVVIHGTGNADGLAGAIDARGISVRDGSSYLSDLSISTPFHATAHVVSLDEIRVRALGGAITASVVVEELRKLTVKGDLHSFSIASIAFALTGRSIGYDGKVDGSVSVNGDFKLQGMKGIGARARLKITPGQRNVPVKGEILAAYSGASGRTDLHQSYIALPHSRIDVSGVIGRELKVGLNSRNLNDFLPLANFSSAQPLTSLPVSLNGRGTASVTATIAGELAHAQIGANATLTNFDVKGSHFDRFGLDVSASPSAVSMRNGSLSGEGLSAIFDGSLGLVNWRQRGSSPVSVNLTLNHSQMRALLALASGGDKSARGSVDADVHIAGTYGNPLGHGNIHTSEGEAYGQQFQRVDAHVSLSNQLARLEGLDVVTAGGTLSATGSFRHPADSMTSGHAEVHIAGNSIQLSGIHVLQQPGHGVAGVVRLNASGAADIANQFEKTKFRISDIEADASADALRIGGEDAGGLTASAHTVNGKVGYKIASNFAGSNVKIEGHTALTAGYSTQASAVVSNLSVGKVLNLAAQNDVPVSGTLSANAQLDGSIDSPDIGLEFNLTKALVYREPLDSVAATIHYTNRSLDIPSIKVTAPAGRLILSGRYDHTADFYHGVLSVHVPESELQVAKIKYVQSLEPGVAGTLRLAADMSATISDGSHSAQILATSVNADVSGKDLRIADRSLGGLTLSAKTANSKVEFQLDSDLAQSQIRASGEAQLAPTYPTRANLTFKNVRYENIAPFLGSAPAAKPLFSTLMEGKASINGPLLDTKALSARLELNQLDLRTNVNAAPTGGPAARTTEFQNQGPVVVTFDKSVAKIDSLHIRGPQTAIDLSGSIDFGNEAAPLAVGVHATADLGVLQNISRNFYSSGAMAVNTIVGGSFADPLVNGKIELHNANINYADVPNGISNGNGLILLEGTTATLQNLRAESGGGKVAVTGFARLSPSGVVYDVRARATKVRTRYAEASVTTNADLALTGDTQHSLLSGTISVQRVAYSSSSDIGSLLYGASAPPSSIAEPSPMLANMRLDIRVVTASDVRVVTSYVQKLNLTGNLTVRGTAAQPGVTGKILLTDGQLAFFGNTYDVKTGSINFYDSANIRPILNLSLETVAQGVNVVLGVTGPVSDMKLSYRSDPPLTFDQIVQLLATNTTPFDATIASQQPPEPQQSSSQMGESAVLGQAVANPLASRVQRVFGLSEFKIDPSVAGSNGQPSARVTLQQKIANNLTFTYITDVTQTNSEIVRVQLDISDKTSAVALRDYNGNVSVELFYKLQKR
jgi:translocation and assembly module TamB